MMALSTGAYPPNEQELQSAFSILRMLLLKFCGYTDLSLIAARLYRQQSAMSDAWNGPYLQRSDRNCTSRRRGYNELSMLITPIRESRYLIPDAS